MLLRRERLSRKDGAEWLAYDFTDGRVVLTSAGRDLLSGSREISKFIRAYQERALGRAALEFPDVRRHLANGGNSDVYTLNDDVVVKESSSNSLFWSLDRMDRLVSIIESGVPRWIDMPLHYGLVLPRKSPKQYLFMQRIDAGITVEDVTNPIDDAQHERVSREWGPVTSDVQEEVLVGYEAARDVLSEAIEASGVDPSTYLTDWHEGNVLVEPLKTPIANSNFRYWIIDQ